jgi:prevent-host-death family protein
MDSGQDDRLPCRANIFALSTFESVDSYTIFGYNYGQKGFLMRHVAVAAFKDRVSEFIAEAQAGEEIIITRHGKEAARLLPPEIDKAALRKEAVTKIRAFRASIQGKYEAVTSEDIRHWLEESRP